MYKGSCQPYHISVLKAPAGNTYLNLYWGHVVRILYGWHEFEFHTLFHSTQPFAELLIYLLTLLLNKTTNAFLMVSQFDTCAHISYVLPMTRMAEARGEGV